MAKPIAPGQPVTEQLSNRDEPSCTFYVDMERAQTLHGFTQNPAVRPEVPQASFLRPSFFSLFARPVYPRAMPEPVDRGLVEQLAPAGLQVAGRDRLLGAPETSEARRSALQRLPASTWG